MYTLTKPVFLIGFMGSGKTSVAAQLARLDNRAWVDLDQIIEAQQGRTISAIFAQSGEEAFRRLETDALAQLASHEPVIVACGGGIIQRPENAELMKQKGFVVYLSTSFETVCCRLAGDTTRPLFQNEEAAHALYVQRRPRYEAAADFTIESVGQSPADIAALIHEELVAEGILC